VEDVQEAQSSFTYELDLTDLSDSDVEAQTDSIEAGVALVSLPLSGYAHRFNGESSEIEFETELLVDSLSTGTDVETAENSGLASTVSWTQTTVASTLEVAVNTRVSLTCTGGDNESFAGTQGGGAPFLMC
jgi:hypothetical protein